jgi:hypothetical protein
MEVLSAMRTRSGATAVALALVAACGGGGGDAPTEPGTSAALANGTMTARVNGAAWRASLLVQATVQRSPTGQFSLVQITGADTVGVPITRARQITITAGLTAPPAVATYPLTGPTGAVPGATVSGQLNQATAIWNTLAGAGAAAGSGTFTITALTDTRIAGTFAFSANPASTNPTDARQAVVITEGRFDIALRTP